MIMFLLRAFIFFLAAAVGLLVADWTLQGFAIDWTHWWGFFVACIIFAVSQSILTPWIASVARRNAPALLGGVGIFSTLIALIVVALLPDMGITIGDPVLLTWLLAPVIVWLVTALATLFLPMIFIKKKVAENRAS